MTIDTPLSLGDCVIADLKKIGEVKQNRALRGRIKGDLLCFGNDDKVINVNSKQEMSVALKKVVALDKKKLDKIKVISGDFKGIIKRDILRQLNVSNPTDEEYSLEELMYCCRFLGGFGAWSGDEDICDADILDRKVMKELDRVVKAFNKKYKLNAYWTTGEKAWVYIYIR